MQAFRPAHGKGAVVPICESPARCFRIPPMPRFLCLLPLLCSSAAAAPEFSESVLFKAGEGGKPYETIAFARFNEEWLDAK
jgi:hypothetical protein